jgi:hypothetical protein
MLSMHENVNVVCNEKVFSSTNVSSKHKRCDDTTSVKLWHYHLCHISRGDGEVDQGRHHPSVRFL